jgi:AcrR family transcriptional regulator
VSTKIRQSLPLPPLERGRTRQKSRTRGRILGAAVALLANAKTPTVAEAADAAGMSRRTAYRYFPTQAKLLTEAALEGLRAPMEAALAEVPAGSDVNDVESRVAVLIDQMQAMAVRNEPLLRTMIHQTVLERGSAKPRRGTRRIDWIEAAVKPLRTRLSTKVYARLVSGLALCGGIEALLVLRDIRGLSEADAIEVSRWAAQALLRQTLHEFGAARTTNRHRPPTLPSKARPR